MSCLKTLDKCFLQAVAGSKVLLGEGWPKNIANPPSIALVIIIIFIIVIIIVIIVIINIIITTILLLLIKIKTSFRPAPG